MEFYYEFFPSGLAILKEHCPIKAASSAGVNISPAKYLEEQNCLKKRNMIINNLSVSRGIKKKDLIRGELEAAAQHL